jgi:hypothetical protein
MTDQAGEMGFAAVLKKEIPQWAKVVRDAGIKLGN